MATAPAYLDALIEARRRMYRLDLRAAADIQRALRDFADDLADAYAREPENVALREAMQIARRAALRLDVRLIETIQAGQDATIRDVLAIWQRAQQEVAAAQGIPNALLGGLPTPRLVETALVTAQRPELAWRTLLRGHTGRAAEEAGAILRSAILQGTSPDTLARQLRRYVVGAEEFAAAFPQLNPADLRGISPAARGAARRMKHNAARIAFSEMHTARGEAEIQHFQADPLVKAVLWTLSQNRGKVRTPDVCDVLAAGDFYGMGPGVYPLRRVPPFPHPWDRCERMPRTRPSWEVAQPKPEPARIRTAFQVTVPGEERLTPEARIRIREQAEEALRLGERVLALVT